MNENVFTIKLSNYLTALEGWGGPAGQSAQVRLRQHIDSRGPAALVRVSLQSVKRLDVTFAREAIIGLVQHYRGSAAFCLVDLPAGDVLENIAAAAAREALPLTIWSGDEVQIVGKFPSPGNRQALGLALARAELRAADLAAASKISVANASTKLKQLWADGFITRRQIIAPSGGTEFVYRRTG